MTQVLWDHVRKELEEARNYWVVTTRQTGAPYARPLWGLWRQNAFYFSVNLGAGTARNLDDNARVGVHLESGDDVVIVDGVAERLAGLGADAAAILDEWARKYPESPTDANVLGSRAIYVVRPSVVRAWTLARYPDDVTRWREPLPA